MSGVVCAFRSDHSDVLAWKARADAQVRQWSLHMKHLKEDYPDHKHFYRESGFRSGRSFAGLEGKETPGEGWRFAKRQGVWLPDKRTKVGKALAERLDQLTIRYEPMPGMPDTTTVDNTWHHYGLTEIDGVVWVTWDCSADAVRESQWSKNGLDESLWAEAPLSSYYLAVENAA